MMPWLRLLSVSLCLSAALANIFPFAVPITMLHLMDTAIPSRSVYTAMVLGLVATGSMLFYWFSLKVFETASKHVETLATGNISKEHQPKAVYYFNLFSKGTLWNAVDLMICLAIIVALSFVNITLGVFFTVLVAISIIGRAFIGDGFVSFGGAVLPIMVSIFVSILTIQGNTSIGAVTASIFLATKIIRSSLISVDTFQNLNDFRKARNVNMGVFAAPWKNKDLVHVNVTTALVFLFTAVLASIAVFLSNIEVKTSIAAIGRSTSLSQIRSVQSPAYGVVDQLLVYNGKEVKAGEDLIILENNLRDSLTRIADRIEETRAEIDSSRLLHETKIKSLQADLNIKKPLAERGLTPQGAITAIEVAIASERVDFSRGQSTISQRLYDLQAQKDGLEQKIRDSTIRASVDGYIEQMIGLGKGSTVNPNTQLFRIVPTADAVIDTRITANDRENVAVGDEVLIYRQRIGSYGEQPIKGRVAQISSDRLEEDKKDVGFQMIVRIDEGTLPIGTNYQVVIPQATVNLREWLVYPVFKSISPNLR